MNVLPHIDVFQPNGYTKEEMKMINETKKIFSDETIKVTATTVRVPTMGGHSEAVNVEFNQDFDLAEVRELLQMLLVSLFKMILPTLSTQCQSPHIRKMRFL